MKIQFGAIFFVLALLASCKAEKSGAAMIKEDMVVARYCVGRSVIALPRPFSANPIVTGQFKTRAMGDAGSQIEVVVRAAQLANGKFGLEVAQMRNELAHRTSGDKLGVIRLEKPIGKEMMLFRVQDIDDAYTSHVLLLRGGSVIRTSLESFENNYLSAEARLIEFANSIEETVRSTQPEEHEGFCLGGVMVTGDLREEAGRFAFEDGRGATFEMAIDTYARDAQVPLLARVSGPDSLLTIFDVHHHVLRSGERTVAGLKVQEWLSRVQSGEDRDAYAFSMETMRDVPGKTAPKIHLSLDTGERLPNGELPGKVMSDDEAIRLWDLVLSSIHPVRP